MDGHVNSTFDPGDGSNWFDMQMTNIPFAYYDVIFYIGANDAQYGDGTGKIVFNGGAERAFKLKSGAFDGNFIEMVNGTTVGNYIVYQGVTGSSFTTQIWGTGSGGFNHVGPCGFQIRESQPGAADILTFTFPGLPATTLGIDTIGVTVPFATNVTALAPTYTIGVGAIGNPPSGTTRNFITPQTYTITGPGPSPVTKTYTVTVTKTPASTACDILSCNFGALGSATITGTNITLLVPPAQPVTALAPTFTFSPLAAPATEVYLKIYRTDSGSDVIYATHRQALVSTAYDFAVPIAAGKFTYKVTYGTRSGGIDSAPLATVSNLLCGDAFIIEGQSNAIATDNTAPNDLTTDPWIRTYGLTTGWGGAYSKGGERQLGLWGWYLAKRLTLNNSMPVCIINGAVGGTRIDQHTPNPTNHALPKGSDSIYANLYNRVLGSKLTHGIRAVLWHQGKQNQGSGGPDGDYDYKFHQTYLVDLSAAWKQDFPNIRNYYVFQIWPAACGDTSRNDQLREAQRTLPRLYSNMRAMSTLGIVPGSSCHYEPAGYQIFSDLIGPLVEQDVYGIFPASVFSAANLKKAFFTTAARNEITLEFDQSMWNNGSKSQYFLDGVAANATSSIASGSIVKLLLPAASSAKEITYLKGVGWDGIQPNLVYGSNGIAALTFADVTIGPPPTPYEAWAASPAQGLTAGFNDGGFADPDLDGINNLLEFALGGAPMMSSQAILPKLNKPGANWVFEYDRSDLALPPATVQVVEYGSDLTGWTPVTIPTTSAGAVTITPGTPSDHVSVAIPHLGNQTFVRLRVSQ